MISTSIPDCRELLPALFEFLILLRRQIQASFPERFVHALPDHIRGDEGVVFDQPAQDGVRQELRRLLRQLLLRLLVCLHNALYDLLIVVHDHASGAFRDLHDASRSFRFSCVSLRVFYYEKHPRARDRCRPGDGTRSRADRAVGSVVRSGENPAADAAGFSLCRDRLKRLLLPETNHSIRKDQDWFSFSVLTDDRNGEIHGLSRQLVIAHGTPLHLRSIQNQGAVKRLSPCRERSNEDVLRTNEAARCARS